MTVHVAAFRTSVLGNGTYGALLEQEMARDSSDRLSVNWNDQSDQGSLGWAIKSADSARNLDLGPFHRDLVVSALACARRSAIPVRPDVSIYRTQPLAFLRPKGVSGIILDETSSLSKRRSQPVRGTMCPSHRAEQPVYRDAAFVVDCSAGAAQSVFQDFGLPTSQVRVVNPGVDLVVRIQPVAKSTNGPLRLPFIGGDIRREDKPSVFRVVGQFFEEVHLDLVSPTTLPFASPNVTVHKSDRPHAAVWRTLIASVDSLLTPSSEESFGLVRLETMTARLPVTVGNALAAPAVVFDSEDGRVVSSSDGTELHAVVSELIRDRAMVDRMAGAAATRAEGWVSAAVNVRAISTHAIEASR